MIYILIGLFVISGMWVFIDDWVIDAFSGTTFFAVFFISLFWFVFVLIQKCYNLLRKKRDNLKIWHSIACIATSLVLAILFYQQIGEISDRSDAVISYIKQCLNDECDNTEGSRVVTNDLTITRKSLTQLLVNYKFTTVLVHYRVSKKDGVVEITSTSGSVIKGSDIRWHSY